MKNINEQYADLLLRILAEGDKQEDRTGVGTYNIPAASMQFDLREGFPILGLKQTAFKATLTELLWFMRGQTNIQPLLKENNHIWSEWPFDNWVEAQRAKGKEMPERYTEDYKALMKSFEEMVLHDDAFARTWGDLGPVYGFQWRSFGGDYDMHDSIAGVAGYHNSGLHKKVTRANQSLNGVDQLYRMIQDAKQNPGSRRLIVSSWQADILDEQALPPCHPFFELTVTDEYVDLSFLQRSSDVFLGLPMNIASYAILLTAIAKELGKTPRILTWHGMNVHLYLNQIEQTHILLNERQPRLGELTKTPSLLIQDDIAFFDLQKEHFTLVDYEHLGKLKAEVAI